MKATNLAALVATCAIANAASAQIIQGTLSNFDVWNNTGAMANDFHIGLSGIPTTAIGGLYTGDYPSVNVASDGMGGTNLTWEGSTTAPGDFAHFGLTIDGNLNPTAVQMNWTFNGMNIGKIPDAWQRWLELTSGIVQDDIFNNSNDVLWVQRGINIVPAGQAISLDDLLVGGELWETRDLIDSGPIPLFPGESLLWDFNTDPSIGAVVMMYEVFDQAPGGGPGNPVITFLNAAVVPTPGAITCFGLAGLVASRRRRR